MTWKLRFWAGLGNGQRLEAPPRSDGGGVNKAPRGKVEGASSFIRRLILQFVSWAKNSYFNRFDGW